ncbi:spore coat protein CotJB [Garciella nitratireducens]|uniref:spore coat protein CotJB n=1 Tax=Garciella nitratireducens TaxID=218205 RepID=UPI000DEB7DE1|nr:spore coat protein CotJB [Garciella nitratireducens]RBP37596.1 spore coat protein JB [Garciella nitratireducens]
MNKIRYQKLQEIQALEFTLVELNLYLDTHPNDQKALREYNTYGKQLQKSRAQYEAMYGPLCNFGMSLSQYPFKWVEEPWPWDM